MSDLAAALGAVDSMRRRGQVPLLTVEILGAAKERLRLTRQPCETCGGSGIAGFYSHTDDGTGEHLGDEEVVCPRCGGSGLGDWPAELVEVAAKAAFDFVYPNMEEGWEDKTEWGDMAKGFRDEARAVLDAVGSYLTEAAGKGSDE